MQCLLCNSQLEELRDDNHACVICMNLSSGNYNYWIFDETEKIRISDTIIISFRGKNVSVFDTKSKNPIFEKKLDTIPTFEYKKQMKEKFTKMLFFT